MSRRCGNQAIAAALALGIAACGGEVDPAGDGGAPDAGAGVGQGSPAAGPLVVNEVAPRGDGADWLELVNRSGAPVDLCEFFVTDALDRLDHYLPLGGAAPPEPCEARPLEAGAYLVIVADDEPGVDHAPFELSIDDGVFVVSATGRTIDSLLYLYQGADGDKTLSRIPDTEGLFYLAEPSPGRANGGGP